MVTQYSDAHQVILRHVGRYRLTMRTALATLVPDSSAADKHVSLLIKDGYLRALKSLPGNRALYQLTRKGCGAADVSVARSRKVGGQSLLKNLGILLFCHVPDMQRHRVEPEELAKALGEAPPDGGYCLWHVKDRTVVLECYVPGPETPVQGVLRQIRKRVKLARQSAIMRQAMQEQRLGFAVIVHTPQRRKAIMDAIRTPDEPGRPPLIKSAWIRVEHVHQFGVLLGTAAPGLRRERSGDAETLF